MFKDPFHTVQLINAISQGNQPTVYFSGNSSKISINPAMDLASKLYSDEKPTNKMHKISQPRENIRKYPMKIKNHRRHVIPDDEKRCVATTKNGEQCKCSKKTKSNYCFVHSKIYDEQIPLAPIYQNKQSCFTKWWNNIFKK